MHRSPSTALAALLVLLAVAPAHAGPSALETARQALERDDPRAAVSALESALSAAPAADRRPILDALRAAYPRAAERARAEGKSAEAETYRDNLEILLPRSQPTARPDQPSPVETPSVVPKTPEVKTESVSTPKPQPAPPPAPAPRPPHDLDTEPVVHSPIPRPLAEPPALLAPRLVPDAPAPATTPALPVLPELTAPKPAVPPATHEPTIRDADEAFNAERYQQAGAIYASLARSKNLPKTRHDHWAYCRAVEVVRKVNARPASPNEWAAINAEIVQIRALSPDNWFAEYLHNLASERSRESRLRAQRSPNKTILRGSSPEEAPPHSPAPASPSPAQHQAPGPATQVNWSRQPIETTNFLVVHVEADQELARQVAQAAENAREAEMKRWGVSAASTAWSPRCEVVIFPSARDFSRETLQPAESPGFSTMGMNSGRIVLRRVHLRSDHPKLVKAILPHEVTHVVLADLFPTKQIPRWADEGMAVLAEPHSEQALRASDLDDPLKTGRLFRLTDLTSMDYPDPKHWALYYAQSVSLTRYLVETGSPAQFVKLVRTAQETGLEPALKSVYGIDGPNDLQTRWLAYARERARDGQAAAVTASSNGAPGFPVPPKR